MGMKKNTLTSGYSIFALLGTALTPLRASAPVQATSPKEAIERSSFGPSTFSVTSTGRKVKGATVYKRDVDGAEFIAKKVA